MHWYPLIVGAVCFQRVMGIGMSKPLSASSTAELLSLSGVLHVTVAAASVALERILPTIANCMPDKLPIVICLLHGCNAVALHLPHVGAAPRTQRTPER